MPSNTSANSTTRYQPILFWSGLGTLIWITLLLYAGGFTTSIRAGMAFLDWPLSNGSINPEGWLENRNMMAEHSHRILGMIMGLLSIGLCFMAYAFKVSRLARRMGIILVALVALQGLLGGLRVKLDQLNLQIDHNLYAQSFAVAHGTLAQLFLCILVAFVVTNSRSWIEKNAGFSHEPDHRLGNWGLIACAILVVQLVIGAIVRHNFAGLAIPTFPLTPYGTLIPPAFDFNVAIHFAHRIGAIVVTVAILALCLIIWTDRNARKALGFSSALLVILLFLQGYLGALVIWTARNPHVTMIHMLNGAVTLAVCWKITYRSLKFRLENPASKSSVQEAEKPRKGIGSPAVSEA